MTLTTVSETLAGRIALHTLHPFCWPEFLNRPSPTILNDLFKEKDAKKLLKTYLQRAAKDYKIQLMETILKGGYPPAALMDSELARRQWFSSYRQTYIERDLLNIKAIENLPDFNRLISLAALRSGRLLNLSDFSRETGLPFTTLRRYMNLLEITYQVFLSALIFLTSASESSKLQNFFNDSGMACHLIGVSNWQTIENQGHAGYIVETWVASELQKIISVSNDQYNLYFGGLIQATKLIFS